MQITRGMRRLLAAVAMLLAAGLSGCGSDSDAGAFFPGATPSPTALPAA